MVILTVVSSLVALLIEIPTVLSNEGFFLVLDVGRILQRYLFPALYLLLVDEYRQQIINLFKRDRKREGEAAILLQAKPTLK